MAGTSYADGPQPVPIAAPPPVPVGTAPAANAPATAQNGPDAVYLKDGGMIRGTIIEVLPGNHASVQLADGRIATIRWDMVDHIDRGTGARPPPTTPAPLPAVGTPPPAVAMVTVHIDADGDAILEQQVTGGRWAGGDWRDVCQAPCDISLPTNTMYRVGGPGVRTSRPFSIEGQNGKAVLEVHTASSGAFAGGIVLISLGPLAIIVGSLVALAGVVENDTSFCLSSSSSGSCNSNRGDGLVAGGLVTMAVGLGATIVGAVLLGTNSRTKVQQPLVTNVAAKLSEKDILNTLGPTTRIPTWNTALERTPPPSTPMVMPFYSGTF